MPRGDSHLANIWTRAQISNSGRGESLCAWWHCRTSRLVPDCLIQTHCMRKRKSVSHWVCCCSITKSRLTLCNPMDCSTPGFPVIHCLLEFAQTHVHWVDNAIQPSHPLSPSSPDFNLSQHQGFSQRVSFSHQVTQLQHQSIQWICMVFPLGLIGLISLQSKGLFSQIPQFINSSALSLLYGTALTSVHDYWKNHSFDYMDICWQSQVFAKSAV